MGILDSRDALTDEESPERLSESFLENTKMRTWGTSEFARAPGEYTDVEVDAMTRAFKRYRLRPTVGLLPPGDIIFPSITFSEAVQTRRTVRTFSPEPLSFMELSSLLHLTGGLTGQYSKQPLRAAPSAGALYPVEIYLSVQRVTGLEPGLYHYGAPDHALARLGESTAPELIERVCCWQSQASQCAVVVFLAGMVQRTVRKYGDRGLRYVFLDAGHLAQNMCLAATAAGLGCMTTCGFYDDEANDLFGLDGVVESMLYVGFVGRQAPPGDVQDPGPNRQD
jgi:SagB-type dehydrogenase family enzyme